MSNDKIIKNQWLFIDESGKPEVYSARGLNLVEKKQASNYLVLAAVRSSNQLELQQLVTAFRLDLLKDKALMSVFSAAYTLDSFHAQTDYPHYTHGGLQVADYVAHALFQVFERQDRLWYEVIKGKIGKIQDICNKRYYTRSNPL